MPCDGTMWRWRRDSLRGPGRGAAPEDGEVHVAEDVDKNETVIGFVLSSPR